MCIIKLYNQQCNKIYDMTNHLKTITPVRGGMLLFLQCLLDGYYLNFDVSILWTNCLGCHINVGILQNGCFCVPLRSTKCYLLFTLNEDF